MHVKTMAHARRHPAMNWPNVNAKMTISDFAVNINVSTLLTNRFKIIKFV